MTTTYNVMSLLNNSTVLTNDQLERLKSGDTVYLQGVKLGFVDKSEGYAYLRIATPKWSEQVLALADENMQVSAEDLRNMDDSFSVSASEQADAFSAIGGISELVESNHMTCKVALSSSVDQDGVRWFNAEVLGQDAPQFEQGQSFEVPDQQESVVNA